MHQDRRIRLSLLTNAHMALTEYSSAKMTAARDSRAIRRWALARITQIAARAAASAELGVASSSGSG